MENQNKPTGHLESDFGVELGMYLFGGQLKQVSHIEPMDPTENQNKTQAC
jgi:hypothetical protein